jgi:hypothetical protein
MVIACIALGIALGGTSVAAVNALPRNTVGTKQLKRNAVTSPKVKDNTITGADVNESSLGQVPSAANAANAAHATSVDTATNATNATNAVNADKVDGYDANSLTRTALMTTGTTLNLTTTLQTYGTALSITAPAPGFVLVTGTYTVRVEAACTTACSARGYIRHIETGAQSTVQETSGYAADEERSNMALAYRFPVSAGVNTLTFARAASLEETETSKAGGGA